MVTTTLYARQQKRHRCIEQSFGLCGYTDEEPETLTHFLFLQIISVLKDQEKSLSNGITPSPFLIATGEAIPLRGLEGVPGLPGAPQDEAGLRRKFETSHV